MPLSILQKKTAKKSHLYQNYHDYKFHSQLNSRLTRFTKNLHIFKITIKNNLNLKKFKMKIFLNFLNIIFAYLCLQNFFLVSVSAKFSPQNLEVQNPQNIKSFKYLKKLLLNQIELHKFNPITLWIYDGENGENTTGFGTLFPTLYNEIPIIVGEELGKGIRDKGENLSSFIFLVNLQNFEFSRDLNSNFEPSFEFSRLLKFLRKNGNPRRDRFIFLAEDETILGAIFEIVGPRRKSGKFISLNYELKEVVGLIIPSGELIVRGRKFQNTISAENKLTNGGEFEKLAVGKWSSLSVEELVGPLMGRGLNGRHIKITGTLLPTWLYRTADEDGPKGKNWTDGQSYHIEYFSNNENFS